MLERRRTVRQYAQLKKENSRRNGENLPERMMKKNGERFSFRDYRTRRMRIYLYMLHRCTCIRVWVYVHTQKMRNTVHHLVGSWDFQRKKTRHSTHCIHTHCDTNRTPNRTVNCKRREVNEMRTELWDKIVGEWALKYKVGGVKRESTQWERKRARKRMKEWASIISESCCAYVCRNKW